MRADFISYRDNIRKEIAAGKITTQKHITDLSIAMQYAINLIKTRKDWFTFSEICEEIKQFAPELETEIESARKAVDRKIIYHS